MYKINYNKYNEMVIENDGKVIATCIDEFLCKEMMSIIGDNSLNDGEFHTLHELDNIESIAKDKGKEESKEECQEMYDDFIDKINDAIGERDVVDSDWLCNNLSLLDFDCFNAPDVEPIK